MLETDLSEDILLHSVEASAPVVDGPDVIFSLAMARKKPLSGLMYFDQDEPDDPAVWSLPDEYLFGDAFLVCPVLNASGKRDVYLPPGEWVDFWSGENLSGPRLIKDVLSPLTRLPLYVRLGSRVEFAEPVQHTGELSEAHRFTIGFDDTYPGFEGSELGKYIGFSNTY